MRKQLTAALAACVVGISAQSSAAASCDSDVIYVRGSSASQPGIKALAKALNGTLKIVYDSSGSSCTGGWGSFIGTGAGGTTITSQTNENYNVYYDTSVGKDCSTDATVCTSFATCDATTKKCIPSGTCTYSRTAGGIDIGVADVAATSCPTISATTINSALYSDNLEFVQAMTFAVQGKQDNPSLPNGGVSAISDVQANVVFGNDVSGCGVTPWTTGSISSDIGNIFARANNSGTQILTFRAAGVDPSISNGSSTPYSHYTPEGTAGALLTALVQVASQANIGIIALQDYMTATNHGKAVALAFEASQEQQTTAFYPGATATSKSLDNVISGQYFIWGALHFITASTPSDNVKKILAALNPDSDSKTAADPTSAGGVVAQALISNYLVPQCAMQVQRTSDLGAIKAYTPSIPCSCFYQATATGTAPSTCTTCTSDAACGTGQCVFGYCEAKN